MVKITDQVYGRSYGTETAEIINVSYPSTVISGEPFTIIYSAWNKTAEPLELWGEIRDPLGAPIQGSSWRNVVPAGGIYYSSTMFSITEDFNGLIVIGHYTGEPPTEPNYMLIGAIVTGVIVIGIVAYALGKKKK